MANPNKSVAAARRRMGGFPKNEPTEGQKASAKQFSDFIDWCVEQANQGRQFSTMEEAQSAFRKSHE